MQRPLRSILLEEQVFLQLNPEISSLRVGEQYSSQTFKETICHFCLITIQHNDGYAYHCVRQIKFFVCFDGFQHIIIKLCSSKLMGIGSSAYVYERGREMFVVSTKEQ